MSGPKSSRYTLTAEQRQALALQQKLQQDRTALALALATLNEHAAFADKHAARLQGLDLPQTQALIQQAQALLQTQAPAATPELQALVQQADQVVQQASQAASVMASLRHKMETQVQESIAVDIRRGFDATLDEALAAREPSAEDCTARLQALTSAVAPATRQKARQALAQLPAVTAPQLLRTFVTLTLLPLERQARQEAALFASEEASYAQLTLRYTALCRELGLQLDTPAWAPGVLGQLEQRIASMEDTLLRQAEERYIRQALDASMAEMGYTLLGERDVHKRSGARFHHALYTTGDGTAIDVTYDANGQIAMELGGLDEADRIPDAHESAVLCQSMEDFCVTFAAFEKHLATKGVVLRERIALQPPSEEYAQIINVQDYHLSGEATLLDVQHTADTERRIQHRYLGED